MLCDGNRPNEHRPRERVCAEILVSLSQSCIELKGRGLMEASNLSGGSRTIMRGPVKPCEGRFDDELQAVLEKNRDRAQWATYRCEVCGISIGATRDQGGRWGPEQHWPSVKYLPSATSDKKQRAPGGSASTENAWSPPNDASSSSQR